MQEIENDQVIEGEDINSKVYEVGYLLVPSISEENIAVNYGNIKELISSLKGEIVADEMPKMIPLAYEMKKVTSNVRSKFNTAYFGWVKFTMSTTNVLELKKALDLDPNFIRFLILKTVKENTIASKRFVRSDVYKKPTKKIATDEVAVPINKEEIDKEIDAMVAV